MKRDDWMLFSLTFLTGAAIGMYVFVIFFKPTYLPEGLSGPEAMAEEWSIVGIKYGSHFEHAGPTFRLLGNRSYIYLPKSPTATTEEPKEGKISRRLATALQFDETQLKQLSEARIPTSPCLSEQGGLDHEYRFTVLGRGYVLDTCHTALAEYPQIAATLEEIWMEIEVGRASGTFTTPAAWLEELLRQHIGAELEQNLN